ncbi:polyprenyl synthetase family protein [Fulvivirga sp. 29W222]|uniref:Polyprenyl synthetase family protein n=1 Tax=Fulvivirga marina TaxID=2494733 RepID=A0A937KBL1_9BACT|nr:polyprenyl synthetase family protein [Fulvivirga marina]MBL6446194.1 polyprenyl synthetase family protein [Fulvivirga marina]
MNNIKQLQALISKEIERTEYGQAPRELYEPIEYIMSLGGKRLRPLLTLLAYSLYKDDVESVLRQAIAVEVFHNFTLMHDDIMDEAPLRRGKNTVHEEWNHNTAILSGDVMLVKAYEMLITDQASLTVEVLQTFNQCAREVCEGQQLDMLFESRREVAEEEYLNMIRQKTAVLLGFSLELGGLLAGAEKQNCEALQKYGINIGIGFQLMDDLLDVYADKEKFGKQVGGDILSNKKTFLLIKALDNAKGEQKKELEGWLEKKQFDPEEKVKAVTKIYNDLGIKELTENTMNEYFEQGFNFLRRIDAPLHRKSVLRKFTESLAAREK